MTEFPCMTPDELALWTAGAENPRCRAGSPCYDCPSWFRAEAEANGRCERRIGRAPNTPEKRREQWRLAGQRKRERARAKAG